MAADDSLSLLSSEAWPPFLPSFTSQMAEALDCFVRLFITQTISYRCGQLNAEEYESFFLPSWVAVAAERAERVEELITNHHNRLTPAAYQDLFSVYERLQSAMRDARVEWTRCCPSIGGKQISFARPLAHRLVRRSHGRLSLRTISDVDDLATPDSASRLCDGADGSSTPRLSEAETQGEVLPLRSAFLFDVGQAGEEKVAEISTSEEHFTGRYSGVYYGDIFGRIRSCSSNKNHERTTTAAADLLSAPLTVPPIVNLDKSYLDQRAVKMNELLNRLGLHCKGLNAKQKAALWRRWWVILAYGVLLPVLVVYMVYCSRQRGLEEAQPDSLI